MSSYIHFTEEEKEQARNTDLAALLKRRGETLWCGIADEQTVAPFCRHILNAAIPLLNQRNIMLSLCDSFSFLHDFLFLNLTLYIHPLSLCILV